MLEAANVAGPGCLVKKGAGAASLVQGGVRWSVRRCLPRDALCEAGRPVGWTRVHEDPPQASVYGALGGLGRRFREGECGGTSRATCGRTRRESPGENMRGIEQIGKIHYEVVQHQLEGRRREGGIGRGGVRIQGVCTFGRIMRDGIHHAVGGLRLEGRLRRGAVCGNSETENEICADQRNNPPKHDAEIIRKPMVVDPVLKKRLQANHFPNH